MRAALLIDHDKPLVVQNVPDPTLDADGVIVRVKATGICRSDLHVARGDWSWNGASFELPLIPGHEIAGVVEAVGSQVQGIEVGDRVLVPFHIACGHCDQCRKGQTNLCRALRFLGGSINGSFAELMAVPAATQNCIPLPDNIDYKTGATLGCRYMTAYSAVRRIANIKVGEWVAVFGAGGGIGLSAVQVATAYGARVIAVDRGSTQLQAARNAGAEHTIDGLEHSNVVTAIKDLSKGGVDASLDAVATATTTHASVEVLDLGGRHVQIGMTGPADRGEISVPVDQIVGKELAFYGVTGTPHAQYDELFALVELERAQPDALITENLPLESTPDALMRMENYEVHGFAIVEPEL